jgi:hypothetical protein
MSGLPPGADIWMTGRFAPILLKVEICIGLDF